MENRGEIRWKYPKFPTLIQRFSSQIPLARQPFRFLFRVNYILRCSPSRSYAAGPLRPKASGISTVDGCASRMTQNKKEAFMKREAKIDSIKIRRSRFGLTGIVYSYGYAYAVRYAPDAIVTEALIRKSWREQRPAFRPYNDSTDTFV